MFIDRLLNQDSFPLLEQVLRFTAARHRLIAQNIANIENPDYHQQDLSLEKFQELLATRLQERKAAAPGEVGFDDIGLEVQYPVRGMLFHDGQNRSIEQLVSDQAKNALMHQVASELLRKQFQTMEMALRERIA